MCGGTPGKPPGPGPPVGLSPRVRGNRQYHSGQQCFARSIPACAGEPIYRQVRKLPRQVYPRVCGGTESELLEQDGEKGLSPRVRGNRGSNYRPAKVKRSIPACAGEPRPSWLVVRACGVYPRVCGGTADSSMFCWRYSGLSPRVRGNRTRAARCRCRQRSIPACAGEPIYHNERVWMFKVYPRVCGGTERDRLRLERAQGLSPRVRGNLQRRPPGQHHRGSIPACAGEPCPTSL